MSTAMESRTLPVPLTKTRELAHRPDQYIRTVSFDDRAFGLLKRFQRDHEAKHGISLSNSQALALILEEHEVFASVIPTSVRENPVALWSARSREEFRSRLEAQRQASSSARSKTTSRGVIPEQRKPRKGMSRPSET